MATLNLNTRALRVAHTLIERAEELGVTMHAIAGARVIDAGVKCAGTLEAGLLTARICLADLAMVQLVPDAVGSRPLPGVMVNVTQPVPACMASQYAGWQVSVGKYFAMGSGPFRAAYAKEELFSHIGFTETPAQVVGVLETGKLPDEATVAYLAQKCGVPPEGLTLVVARTASLVGGVQVVARSVETALHKLHELRFDLKRVVAGVGWAPLPPIARDDLAAIGRTNDAVLYGGRVGLWVTGDDASLRQAGEQLPSSASKDYGRPFADIFRGYGHDFYKIDKMLFSPAAVTLQNVSTGSAMSFGAVSEEVLRRSFFEER